MLKDLVTTTESYKVVQEKEARLSSDLSLAQAQLFPLKKQNAHYARENYQLHIDGIKAKDDHAKQIEDKELAVKKLEEQMYEMKYMMSGKDEMLRKLEEESVKLKQVTNTSTYIYRTFIPH